MVGNRTKVKVVKNKVASPFREAEFDIIYGEGVSKEGDLLDLGVAQNIVEKSGSWFSYKGERIGQGRENARQFLKDNHDIRQAVDTELRKALGLTKSEPAEAEAPAGSSHQLFGQGRAGPPLSCLGRLWGRLATCGGLATRLRVSKCGRPRRLTIGGRIPSCPTVSFTWLRRTIAGVRFSAGWPVPPAGVRSAAYRLFRPRPGSRRRFAARRDRGDLRAPIERKDNSCGSYNRPS